MVGWSSARSEFDGRHGMAKRTVQSKRLGNAGEVVFDYHHYLSPLLTSPVFFLFNYYKANLVQPNPV
jgi:hypothetical protein